MVTFAYWQRRKKLLRYGIRPVLASYKAACKMAASADDKFD